MNREVHVRFWESAGLRCPAPLTFIKAYGSVAEARRGIGGWLSFYNEERLHQALVRWPPKTGQAAKRESSLGTAGWPEVRLVKYPEEAQP
jgi:hypothetical protein